MMTMGSLLYVRVRCFLGGKAVKESVEGGADDRPAGEEGETCPESAAVGRRVNI